MKINIKTLTAKNENDRCLMVGVYEGGELTTSGKEIDKSNQNVIANILKQGIFEAKAGQTLPLFPTGKSSFTCILLIGCGKKNKLNATLFRKIVISAIISLRSLKIRDAACFLSEIEMNDRTLAWKIKKIAEITWESVYQFDLFKSDKQPNNVLKNIIIHLPDAEQKKKCEKALEQGLAIAAGVTLAKNLGNTPSNICTPSFLADQAREIAKEHKLSLKILDEKEMQKLGMGALLGVSQGSAEEAKLICLEYKGGNKKQAPVVLIGKGVTFDTGGNSLKPADSMVGMKYDMCGAASVLGTLKAAALLDLPLNVVGIIPAVENMPGGTGYKPEDILTSLSGQTIEVISTDAEGRLILADALTYAERYKPDVVIDIATLTGAVVIALGSHASALLSNNEKLSEDLLKAGIESHDRAWPLPLWDEYQEQIKSPFADMANLGGRSAGTITAACFLSRFAKKYDWAHIDVAGTAAMMSGISERMATGRPVPMLTQYLINKANKS